MDLLKKSDEEIITIAKPIWENLVKSSNIKDYGGFTKDFGTRVNDNYKCLICLKIYPLK